MAAFARIVAVLLGLGVVLFFALRLWDVAPDRREAAPADAKAPVTVTTQAEPAAPAMGSPPTAPEPGAPTVEAAKSAEAKPVEAKPVEAKPLEPRPGETKPHLLAREQAEKDRLASLKQGHAVTPEPPKTKLYFKVQVRDGSTLETGLPKSASAEEVSTVTAPPGAASSATGAAGADASAAGGLIIRLEGIAVREVGATCINEEGLAWPCGASARAALVKLIRSRAVTCTLPPGGERPEFASRCSVAGTDLATWMVRHGWAEPKQGGERALADALKAAKDERAGIWRGGE
jgi:endonuclease YncB( thermonuclease family)